MQIVMVSGSRNREGRTARMLEAVAKGIAEAGGSSETIFLPELNLERCRQCEKDGWGICQTEHRCIIQDDFDSVVTKLKAADVAVFASPVYFFDLTESLRSFLDRLRRITPRPGPGSPATPLSPGPAEPALSFTPDTNRPGGRHEPAGRDEDDATS